MFDRNGECLIQDKVDRVSIARVLVPKIYYDILV